MHAGAPACRSIVLRRRQRSVRTPPFSAAQRSAAQRSAAWPYRGLQVGTGPGLAAFGAAPGEGLGGDQQTCGTQIGTTSREQQCKGASRSAAAAWLQWRASGASSADSSAAAGTAASDSRCHTTHHFSKLGTPLAGFHRLSRLMVRRMPNLPACRGAGAGVGGRRRPPLGREQTPRAVPAGGDTERSLDGYAWHHHRPPPRCSHTSAMMKSSALPPCSSILSACGRASWAEGTC